MIYSDEELVKAIRIISTESALLNLALIMKEKGSLKRQFKY